MKVLANGDIQLRRGLPFAEREMRIAVTLPAKWFEKTRRISMVRRGEFGAVLQEVQRQYPEASISVTTVRTLD